MNRQDNALTYLPEGWWSNREHLKQAEKAINIHMSQLAERNNWKEVFSGEQYKQYIQSAGLAIAELRKRRQALAIASNDNSDFRAMQLTCEKLEVIVGRDIVRAARREAYAEIERAKEEINRRPSPPGHAVQFLASCGGHRLRAGERMVRAGALVLEGYRDGK